MLPFFRLRTAFYEYGGYKCHTLWWLRRARRAQYVWDDGGEGNKSRLADHVRREEAFPHQPLDFPLLRKVDRTLGMSRHLTGSIAQVLIHCLAWRQLQQMGIHVPEHPRYFTISDFPDSDGWCRHMWLQ